MAENDGAFHLTWGTQLPDGLFIIAEANTRPPVFLFCEGLTLNKHFMSDDTFERVLLGHHRRRKSRRAPHRHRRRQKRAEQNRRHRISIAPQGHPNCERWGLGSRCQYRLPCKLVSLAKMEFVDFLLAVHCRFPPSCQCLNMEDLSQPRSSSR